MPSPKIALDDPRVWTPTDAATPERSVSGWRRHL